MTIKGTNAGNCENDGILGFHEHHFIFQAQAQKYIPSFFYTIQIKSVRVT